ncbi:hypothetical protein C7H85_18920 [Zobellella endophytica]|uniref:Acyloxyacyl hydrolase n=1 Tax=Zobellella endophytica TaxID=2116700 RepID=A0A2P7QQS4_9GAMM|nr:acyloxyacyl hydrolase [Zobellella endophytica]PSJ40325.1 hypothetical protein C7H85_18920 [Zobellella endophytica]
MNKTLLLLFALAAAPAQADWSLVVGAGGGDGADRLSLGAEWQQPAPWFESDSGQFDYGLWFDSSYWELGDDELVQLSLVPTLYYATHADGLRPFAFVGVGPAWISQTRLEQRRFSTQFQFSSRVGVGVALARHSLALEGGHLSNAGIARPNDGLTSWGVSYRYNF